MMLSVNYEFNSFGVRWAIIFRNVGSSHGLWVLSSFPFLGSGVRRMIRGFQSKKTSVLDAEIMRGKRKWVEPPSCAEWKNKPEVWDILRRGNFTSYMERLKGNNPTITHQFVKSWKDDSVLVENQWMDVTEEIIAEDTGLDLDGINFYRERKLFDKEIDDFVEIEEEIYRLGKIGNSYFNLAYVSRPWHFVFFVMWNT